MPIALAVACIASVHDADTVRLCNGTRVRLIGIDAPEVKGAPRCRPAQRKRLAGSRNPAWCDYAKGAKARDALRAYLKTGPVRIESRGHCRSDSGRCERTQSSGSGHFPLAAFAMSSHCPTM